MFSTHCLIASLVINQLFLHFLVSFDLFLCFYSFLIHGVSTCGTTYPIEGRKEGRSESNICIIVSLPEDFLSLF